ncbi:hypothetical protein [Actinomadura sp. WMMA1423]|uniref:hypothetical protein n=1 Tax=Actinomadura sp. WMMA1423 TaxID=2591108 RepID=UPI001147119C|nr:hypothetical protein [Actinomadura sp. WMMA1423]
MTLHLYLRDGARQPDVIDSDRLSPRARALAEAIASGPASDTGKGVITCMRRDALEGMTVAQAAKAIMDDDLSPQSLASVGWRSWSRYPAASAMDPHEYLEIQARRIPGDWVIIGHAYAPGPQAQAAVADQGITASEVLETLRRLGRPVAPGTWRSYVARGQAPRPVRHVGTTPLWERQAVVDWAQAPRRPGTRTDLTR